MARRTNRGKHRVPDAMRCAVPLRGAGTHCSCHGWAPALQRITFVLRGVRGTVPPMLAPVE